MARHVASTSAFLSANLFPSLMVNQGKEELARGETFNELSLCIDFSSVSLSLLFTITGEKYVLWPVQ